MSLIVNTDYDGSVHLVLDVVSSRTQRYLYTVQLLHLYGIEYTLNAGRFVNFSRIPQQNHIAISSKDVDNLKRWVGSIIEWIAEQTQETWSFYPKMETVQYGEFDFSFANASTAVAFALVWM